MLSNSETEEAGLLDKKCTVSVRGHASPPRASAGKSARFARQLGLVCAVLVFLGWAYQSRDITTSRTLPLETCAWNHLESHLPLLSIPPIGQSEFLARQDALIRELDAAGVDAFVAEPSASTSYYANVSSNFHLSERPFLLVIGRDGKFSTLVPNFEAGRIAKLDMVYRSRTTITWAEEVSPYEMLARGTGYSKVMVDEHARFMIVAGLQEAGIEVVPMSEAVKSLRSVKTDAEIALLRGINAFTLSLVRSLQKCIRIGITQEAILAASQALFTRAGVGSGFWALVLFGDQAALPHGGETGRTLQHGEFVLIDIGSELHGYCSDVTRTILPPLGNVSTDLLGIWYTVLESQTAGLSNMQAGEVCSRIDGASRDVISQAGYGEFYTHRLGHGLGLEGHEPPYLNGANMEKLKLGEVATNEPVCLCP